MDGREMAIVIGIDHFLEDQEGGLIQGTILVVVDEDVGVVVATLAMRTMVEAGQITLAVAEVDGAQAAVVAPPRVLVVMAEALGVGMLLDGVELAVITTAAEAVGEQWLVVLMVLVVEVEGAGEQQLVALTTQGGAALKKPFQHRMVGAAGALVAAVAGDEFVLHTCVLVHRTRSTR